MIFIFRAEQPQVHTYHVVPTLAHYQCSDGAIHTTTHGHDHGFTFAISWADPFFRKKIGNGIEIAGFYGWCECFGRDHERYLMLLRCVVMMNE